MSNPNLGWLFYKDYYTELNYHDISSEENSDKLKEKVANLKRSQVKLEKNNPLGNKQFKATTTYPGLLLGSGNSHELPSVEGQAILGFHFDYTTGLPVIPASSIKGVLRSAFEHTDYIEELLKEDGIEGVDIKRLELDIFGQENGSDDVTQGRDIFFDAVITGLPAGRTILDDDYITPHKNSKKIKDSQNNLIPDELCNPIPLRFIKVKPGVTFEFDFKLHDGVIKKKNKYILFTKIVQDFGIGAKTNVGYGQFKIKFESENPCENHILNSKKASEDLLKKLKECIDEKSKSYILSVFEKKYHSDNGKFAKKIRNLLS